MADDDQLLIYQGNLDDLKRWIKAEAVFHEAAKEKSERSFREKLADYNSQDRALAVLDGYIHEGEPYAVFLRSFRSEAYHLKLGAATAAPAVKGVKVVTGVGEVEQKLQGALEGVIPLVAISNPADPDPSQGGLIPRFNLPDDIWLEVVTQILGEAYFIVMDCQMLAPGVTDELEAIRRASKQDRTVVILPQGQSETERATTLATVTTIVEKDYTGDLEIPAHERPNKDHPQLASFSRVVYANEIDFDDLGSSYLFIDYLTGMDRQRAINRSYRGMKLLEAGMFDKARDLLEAALKYWTAVGNAPVRMSVLRMLGLAHLRLSDVTAAARIIGERIVLAQQIEDRAEEASATELLRSLLKKCGLPGEDAP